MIRKEGEWFVVRSEDGTKVLGRYRSKADAEKRIAQVEYFKSNPDKGKK